MVLKVSMCLPSSEPFMIILSTPNSSHKARATVVLPVPAVPERRRFGNSLLSKNLEKVFFKSSLKIQSDIF